MSADSAFEGSFTSPGYPLRQTPHIWGRPESDSFVIEASSPEAMEAAENTMIRGFVMIALGGTLLAMAVPALAEKAPPRPARSSATRAIESRPAPSAPQATPAQTAREDTREASVTRAARPGPKLPHPFRAQVLPEGRV